MTIYLVFRDASDPHEIEFRAAFSTRELAEKAVELDGEPVDDYLSLFIEEYELDPEGAV